MNNKQKLLNIVKNLNLTQSQQNELVNVLSSGLGSGKEDKVFEIKIRTVFESENVGHTEFMINGIGWFTGTTNEEGYLIDTLNGEPWEFSVEAVKEMFKDIESCNKLKLTEFMPISEIAEIPISTTEELTCQVADVNGFFGIMLFSKVYASAKTKYFLMATVYGDGGVMTFAW